MAWRPFGARPLSKAMLTQKNAHICVLRPQRVDTSTILLIWSKVSQSCADALKVIILLVQHNALSEKSHPVANTQNITQHTNHLNIVSTEDLQSRLLSYAAITLMRGLNPSCVLFRRMTGTDCSVAALPGLDDGTMAVLKVPVDHQLGTPTGCDDRKLAKNARNFSLTTGR